MATLHEQMDSRSETVEGDSPTAERIYIVKAAANEEIAKATFKASSDAKMHGDLERTSFTIERHEQAETWFKITATYERPDPETPVGPVSIPSIDVSNTTIHVDNSFKTLAAYGPSALSSRVGTANPINVVNGVIGGADILAPVSTLAISQVLGRAVVTNAYVDLLISLVGKVNVATFTFIGESEFLGWPAGCVLFMGASGTRRDDWDWDFTYNFGIAPEKPAETIGGVVNGVSQSFVAGAYPGWALRVIEYKDVMIYRGGPYINGQQPFDVVRIPVAAYVEQVYPDGNLALIGVDGF